MQPIKITSRALPTTICNLSLQRLFDLRKGRESWQTALERP